MKELKPGETWGGRIYVELTDSGQVTLQEGAGFSVTKKDANGMWFTTEAPDPLAGHWPSLKITIDSKVPEGRKLSFSRSGKNIIVNAPEGARGHLLYQFYLKCSGGAEQAISSFWELITGNEVQIPISDYCISFDKKWKFAISAVGYNIVTGDVTSII